MSDEDDFLENECGQCGYCSCQCCFECDCYPCDCDMDDEPDPDIGLSTRSLVFHKANKNEFSRNPSRRFISLELEIDGLASWGDAIEGVCEKRSHSIVEDGSLSSKGFEINTSPAQGDRFCEHVEELCEALKKHGAVVTHRCGMHVHVDARDYNHWDIRKLAQLYRRVEAGLMQVVSMSRRGNEYCRPCGEGLWSGLSRNPRKPKHALDTMLYGTSDSRTTKYDKEDKHGSSKRYDALNVHSWMMRGTIESRLHQGTSDAAKAVRWGILWAGLLDWAYRANSKDLANLPEDPFEALLSVCPTEEVREHLIQRRKELN